MWHVVGIVVPETLNECCAFMFSVKQSKTLNPEDQDIMILQTVRKYKPNEGVILQKIGMFKQHHCKNLKSCILIFCASSHGILLARFSSSEQKFGVCEIFVKSIIQAVFLIFNININLMLQHVIPVQYTFLFNENQSSKNIRDFKTFTFKFSSNTYCIWTYPQTAANPMYDFSFSLSLQPGPVL